MALAFTSLDTGEESGSDGNLPTDSISPAGATIEVQGRQPTLGLSTITVSPSTGTIEIQGSAPTIAFAKEIQAGVGTLIFEGSKAVIVATGYWAKIEGAGVSSWVVQSGAATTWERTTGHATAWTKH